MRARSGCGRRRRSLLRASAWRSLGWFVRTGNGIHVAVNDEAATQTGLTPEQAEGLIEAGAELIDVRRPYEFDGGRLAGGILGWVEAGRPLEPPAGEVRAPLPAAS